MFVHVLIGSVTAICSVHHYNYDGTDFVSVVTCVVVFLHYIIYVYFTYNFVATARNKINIYLSIYLYILLRILFLTISVQKCILNLKQNNIYLVFNIVM